MDPLSAVHGSQVLVNTTGTIAITSGPCAILGVLFQSTGTANCTFWASASGAQISGVVRAWATAAAATMNTAVYVPFPAVLPTGFSVSQPVQDPSLTIFWKPLSKQ